MIKEILIGTHNHGKIAEYRSALGDLEEHGIRLRTTEEFQISEPEEVGSTFEENALLKAKHYAEASGLPSVSDDGGIEIDALDGKPGVYSRRWLTQDLGHEASDQELIDGTLERLNGVTHEKRTARMKLVACFYDPSSGTTLYGYGTVEGHIADKAKEPILENLPYRSLLIVDPYGKYYNELTPQEHDQVNHRFQALENLAPQIANLATSPV